MTKNEVDISRSLEESYQTPESIFDGKRTKTSHFLLNTIFPNNSLTATEYFVNAFIDDEKFKHTLLRPIFILFKVSPKDNKWNTLSQRIRAKNEFILQYFCGIQDNKNLLMYVFRIPEKYSKEYTYFLAGKYSRFSEEYKKIFPQFIYNERNVPTESTIWRVLHKSEVLKKELTKYFGEDIKFGSTDELWGMPEPKFEVYRHE